MTLLRACFVVGLLALAACGSSGSGSADAAIDQATVDAKVYNDAPPPMFDFSCTANQTPPSTAPAMITLGGTVQALSNSGGSFGATPVNMAKVFACKTSSTNCTYTSGNDGKFTTAADGMWSIANIATGGNALDDYIEMTATGYRTMYLYPDAPFSGNVGDLPMLTFDSQTESLLGLFGCDTSKAIVGVALLDCSHAPITDGANVTITLKQGGSVVTGTTTIDVGMYSSMAAGAFLVCGVPANASTEVSATYKTTQFRPHNVKTVIATTTSTLLVPGY